MPPAGLQERQESRAVSQAAPCTCGLSRLVDLPGVCYNLKKGLPENVKSTRPHAPLEEIE
jgi:hypothetical protein